MKAKKSVGATGILREASKATGIRYYDMVRIYEAFIDILMDVAKRGEKVRIPDFGIFILKERKGRIGRDVKRGVQVKIPARKVLTFKPSRNLLALVRR